MSLEWSMTQKVMYSIVLAAGYEFTKKIITKPEEY